jgi:hypothetical protein
MVGSLLEYIANPIPFSFLLFVISSFNSTVNENALSTTRFVSLVGKGFLLFLCLYQISLISLPFHFLFHYPLGLGFEFSFLDAMLVRRSPLEESAKCLLSLFQSEMH